jgi:hypothetical protein
MARKKTTGKTAPSIPTATPRHLWLAGLGLASIARKQSMAAASEAADRVCEARRQATAAVDQAQSDLIAAAGELRTRLEAGAAQLGSTLETTLSPLVAKFKPAKAKRTVRRGRKPGSKNVRRTAAKKTVKTVKRARKV